MQQNYTYRQDLRLTVHQRTTLPMKIKQTVARSSIHRNRYGLELQ